MQQNQTCAQYMFQCANQYQGECEPFCDFDLLAIQYLLYMYTTYNQIG